MWRPNNNIGTRILLQVSFDKRLTFSNAFTNFRMILIFLDTAHFSGFPKHSGDIKRCGNIHRCSITVAQHHILVHISLLSTILRHGLVFMCTFVLPVDHLIVALMLLPLLFGLIFPWLGQLQIPAHYHFHLDLTDWVLLRESNIVLVAVEEGVDCDFEGLIHHLRNQPRQEGARFRLQARVRIHLDHGQL